MTAFERHRNDHIGGVVDRLKTLRPDQRTRVKELLVMWMGDGYVLNMGTMPYYTRALRNVRDNMP